MAQTELQTTINVLGVREEGSWCAIALEMSLRGYGETFSDALDELLEAIDAQVSFAVRNDTVDRIFVPAEPEYFRLFANLKHEALKRRLRGLEQTGLPEYRVGDIPLPAPTDRDFAPVPA